MYRCRSRCGNTPQDGRGRSGSCPSGESSTQSRTGTNKTRLRVHSGGGAGAAPPGKDRELRAGGGIRTERLREARKTQTDCKRFALYGGTSHAQMPRVSAAPRTQYLCDGLCEMDRAGLQHTRPVPQSAHDPFRYLCGSHSPRLVRGKSCTRRTRAGREGASHTPSHAGGGGATYHRSREVSRRDLFTGSGNHALCRRATEGSGAANVGASALARRRHYYPARAQQNRRSTPSHHSTSPMCRAAACATHPQCNATSQTLPTQLGTSLDPTAPSSRLDERTGFPLATGCPAPYICHQSFAYTPRLSRSAIRNGTPKCRSTAHSLRGLVGLPPSACASSLWTQLRRAPPVPRKFSRNAAMLIPMRVTNAQQEVRSTSYLISPMSSCLKVTAHH